MLPVRPRHLGHPTLAAVTVAATLTAGALALVAPLPSARADIFASTFHSSTWMVEMVVPRDWELYEQTSYPGILVYAENHKTEAQMTLAAQRLDGEELSPYAERNARALVKLGYHLSGPTARIGGALLVEGTTPNEKHSLRQAYVLNQGTVYVLSISAPVKVAPQVTRAFEDTLRSLTFTGAVGPESQPAASQPASAPANQPPASQPATAPASAPTEK